MNGAPCQHRVLDDPFGQKTCQKSFAQWECCFNNFLLKTQLGHEQIQKMSQMLESFKSSTLLNTGQHTRALAIVMWDEPSSKAGPRKSLCNPLYRELLGIVHFIFDCCCLKMMDVLVDLSPSSCFTQNRTSQISCHFSVSSGDYSLTGAMLSTVYCLWCDFFYCGIFLITLRIMRYYLITLRSSWVFLCLWEGMLYCSELLFTVQLYFWKWYFLIN